MTGIEATLKNDSQLQGERRWTAVLCADLVDFTGISSRLGPERTYELMREVVSAARSEIERCGGNVIEYAGDALIAVFGAPIAAENASLEACRAALSVQQKMLDQAETYLTDFSVQPQFRIGLAGGSVVFGSLGKGESLDINVLGDAVNLASRIQKITAPGTVICSDSIFDQVEGFVEVETNGPTKIKGFIKDLTTHLVTALKANRSQLEGRMRRGAKSFFGRKRELQQLQTWWSDGEAGLIEISGPPGAGKSRLIHEFAKRIQTHSGMLIGHCHENTQQTPLVPIIEIIRLAIDWDASDTRAKIEKKLAAFVAKDGAAFDYIVNRIGKFEAKSSADVSHSDNAISIRRACAKALRAIAEKEGSLFLIEDAHWIDVVSEAVILNLIDKEQGHQCRFVTTRRHHILREWSDYPTIAKVELTELGPESVRELVLDLLGVATADRALTELIDEKSDRIPLFVEEIVRYLQFSGSVEIDKQSAKLAPGAGKDILSGNLQHLVLSRFDALPAADRKLLILAATRGRQFSAEFLKLSDIGSVNPDECVRRAQEQGLVERDPGGGLDQWTFSHALIRDAIYGSQLGPQRRQNHALVAEMIEKEPVSGRQSALVDELALHFKLAGDQKKAVKYLRLSAERAYEIFSVVQVDNQLESAFSLIEAQPDLVDDETFGQMLFLWGRTLDIYGHYRKLNEIMDQHLPRLKRLGASEVLSLCMSLKALARCHAAEFHDAQSILDNALEIAKEVDHELPFIWAKVIQMRINVDSGFADLSATEVLYQEVKPRAEQLQDSHLIQLSTYVMMTAHRGEGALKRANEYVEWLEEYGRTNNSSRAIAMCAWARCVNHLVRDQLDQGIEAADENLRLTVAPTGDWRVATVGRLVARLGRGDEGVEVEDLLPIIEMLAEFDDTTLGNAARQQYWIHTMTRGGLYRGWRGLNAVKAKIRTHSTPEIRRFIELVQAEVLMSISGVIPRNGPRPKMGLLDILMALRLKMNARRMAKAHLSEFLKQAPFRTGYFIARIERDLGMIAKADGDLEAAKSHFLKSIQLYENEDMFESALTVEQLISA